MEKDQKTALARIISDLIKADNIIEKDEMRMLAELDAHYHIGIQNKIDAQHKSFTWAVNLLKSTLSKSDRKEVLHTMEGLSRSDGSCVPREALLLLALKYSFISYGTTVNEVLPSNRDVKTFSCDLKSSNLNDIYIVYVESSFNEDVNREIEEDFYDICDILSNCGIDFVYVPSLRKDFEKMDEDYVRNVITYMAPHLLKEGENARDNGRISEIYDKLKDLDTTKFCRDLLFEKIGVEDMANIQPSLLINIGTSLEPYCGDETKIFTEFLCLPIKETVKKDIRRITNDFRELLTNSPTPHNGRGFDENFKYFGFYKALFDLIVFHECRKKEVTTVIDMDRHCIRFEGLEDSTLSISPKAMAIYTLIMLESCGQRTYPERTRQKLVEWFYDRGFNGIREVGEYSNGLAVQVAKIKKAITSQFPNLPEKEVYIPKKVDQDYKVLIDPRHICIIHDERRLTIKDFDPVNEMRKAKCGNAQI